MILQFITTYGGFQWWKHHAVWSFTVTLLAGVSSTIISLSLLFSHEIRWNTHHSEHHCFGPGDSFQGFLIADIHLALSKKGMKLGFHGKIKREHPLEMGQNETIFDGKMKREIYPTTQFSIAVLLEKNPAPVGRWCKSHQWLSNFIPTKSYQLVQDCWKSHRSGWPTSNKW